jgi:ATP-dependent helicase HrpA
MRVLEGWRTTDKAISGRADLMTLPALTDMRAQVARLVAPGFIGEAGTTRLRDYPRYLAAVVHRRERLDQRATLALVGSPYPSVGELLADLRAGLVGQVVDAHPTVRDETSYDAVVAAARDAVARGLGAAVHDVMRVLEAWRATDRAISGRADLMTLPALTDMRAQVSRLMAPGFVADAGTTRLRDYPRYLAAVTHRRERLDAQVARDRQLMDQLAGLQEAWLHAVAALPDGQPVPQHLREARWLLEEYRVSLFAQQLGTREKVSDQRIRKVMGSV